MWASIFSLALENQRIVENRAGIIQSVMHPFRSFISNVFPYLIYENIKGDGVKIFPLRLISATALPPSTKPVTCHQVG